MRVMGKQDNIFEKGNLSGLPFSFNKEVTEVFEDMIDRSVPGYKTSLSLISHYAQRFYQKDTNCYDLGCSLGASSLSIVNNVEDVRVIAIDNSEAMINECIRRFQESPKYQNVQFLQEDIMESTIENASFIVVNYLVQFLDLTQRDMLFEKIYRALLPGGVLLVSEKVHYENKYQTNRIFRTHHKFKAANGYSDLEISGKRDSLEGVLLTEYEEDHLLRASKAGFKKTEKVLSNLNFRTFVFLK